MRGRASFMAIPAPDLHAYAGNTSRRQASLEGGAKTPRDLERRLRV